MVILSYGRFQLFSSNEKDKGLLKNMEKVFTANLISYWSVFHDQNRHYPKICLDECGYKVAK